MVGRDLTQPLGDPIVRGSPQDIQSSRRCSGNGAQPCRRINLAAGRYRVALRLLYQTAIVSWKTLLKIVQDPQRFKKERLRQESILMDVTRREEEA